MSRPRLLMLFFSSLGILSGVGAFTFGYARRSARPTRISSRRALHRHAQWRLDFVAAENSMGFHAPQELARILAEAIDYARQGQRDAERAAPKK